MTACLHRQQPSISTRNARLAGVLALALIMLVLAGCATTPRLGKTTLNELPRQGLVEGVPFHAQRDYQCGPASLAMVLNASGTPADVDSLIPQVFIPGREGSVQPEMLATVRRQGLIPFRIDGTLDALLREIDAGHPVVVMQNLSLPAWPLWHYAVAIGFDLDEQLLTLHSGMEARRIESFKRFDATWARSDRWAFVALPPGELPASLAAQDLLQPISDFEQTTGSSQALAAWRAASQRHPYHAMLKFALGNALSASEDSAGAIQAFRDAVVRDPGLAEAWLNLGLLLSEDAPGEGREALEKAAGLSGPWQQQARQAMEALDREKKERAMH